jgi:hypothetical protein
MRPFVAFGALGVFVALPAFAQNAVPIQAQNQGTTTTTTTTTQGGGGGGAAPAGQGAQGGQGAGGQGDKAQPGYGEGKGSGNMGGYSYDDKPKRGAGTPAKARHVKKHAGPVVNLPGFEQTPDGGSRVFVSLTSTVPVEEHKAQGSVTYVLKGAGVRVWNNSNALVTVHFNTPVSKARLVPHGNDAHLVIEMRAASTPTWKMTEGQDKSAVLQIDFPKGDFAPADNGGPELRVDSGEGGDGGEDGDQSAKRPNSGTPPVPKKKTPGKPAGATKPGPSP